MIPLPGFAAFDEKQGTTANVAAFAKRLGESAAVLRHDPFPVIAREELRFGDECLHRFSPDQDSLYSRSSCGD